MAEKKKQHYVPKVYLKLFACNRTINVFDISSSVLHTKVLYEDQFKKKYFYGADKVVEKILEKYETPLGNLFKEMQRKLQLTDKDIRVLFYFLLLQKHRVAKNSDVLHEIVSYRAKMELKAESPETNDRLIESAISQFFDKNKKEFTQSGYKIAVDEIQKLIDSSSFEKYDVKIMDNASHIEFISSDNPVCMINPTENKILETGDMEDTTVFLFPLGFRKLVVVYRKDRYKICKNKLNQEDVLLINSISFLNAKRLLIVPNDFPERQIRHWMSTIQANRQEISSSMVFQDDVHELIGITPASTNYVKKIKFIQLL